MQSQIWKLPVGILAALSLVAAPVAMSGCEREGPMERAGERLDRAGEDVEDAFEDLGDEIDDQFDRR
jgi:hypothetical protein